MYAYYWSKLINPVCLVLIYNSHIKMTGQKFYSEDRAKRISEMSEKLGIPVKILKPAVWTRKLLMSILNFYLLPFAILKKIPYKIIASYKKDYVTVKPIFDYYLVHNSFEKDKCIERTKMPEKIAHIKCPLKHAGKTLNSHIYKTKAENNVLILPAMIGFESFKQEKPVTDEWISGIQILQFKFPEYNFILKFHPRTSSNPAINEIEKHITDNCPWLTILDPKEVSEKWILKSRIIAGDVSTVLWWADQLYNKIVISLDMKNFAGSDDMKYYRNVIYFKDLDALENYDFNVYGKKNNNEIKNKAPTALQFLESINPNTESQILTTNCNEILQTT